MCSPSAHFPGFWFLRWGVLDTYLFVSFTNDKILQTLYSIADRFETYPYNLVWSVFLGVHNDYEAIAFVPLTILKSQ